MPRKYKSCVRKVKAKGHNESSAHAVCTARNAGNIKEYRKHEKRHK